MSDIGYEEPQIDKQGARDNLAAHSHSEISRAFENMTPTEASAASDDYAKIAAGWEDDITTFAARIRRSSQSAWEGPAAEASRQAVNDYATDATNLSLALQGLANRVDDAANAVLNTKNGMPPVKDDPQSWWNPGDWLDGDGGVSEAEENARVHVTNNYGAGIAAADAQIPVLPLPKDPAAVEQPGAGDPGVPGDTSTGGDPAGPSGNPTEPGTPGQEVPGEEQPGAQQPAEDEAGTEDTQPATTEPAGTTPQSTVPSTTGSPGVPSTTAAPPGGPGSPAGTPGPGSGVPGPGQTVQGSPVPAGAPAGPAGPQAPSGTPAGRGGMPMMGAPGGARGGSGEDDGNRQTPDYLINEENTRELLGEEAPTLPGGVLGAEAPSAQPVERPPGY
ncbi:WXG100 family type VII secretion target [Nocardia flavorosea]|uniref:WXG100 family type VII secretion target n=1 Tax=Nocardia flavorosea TaxID=53429 RepID=UPI002456FA77|nr:WXG100 family type VII secretion target [Nocardia flavorosea]